MKKTTYTATLWMAALILFTSLNAFGSGAEDESSLESWMSEPFALEFAEADPGMESWMVESFSVAVAESGLEMESWMAESFSVAVAESGLEMESWMAEPFAIEFMAGDHNAIEEWMTTPFEGVSEKESEKLSDC